MCPVWAINAYTRAHSAPRCDYGVPPRSVSEALFAINPAFKASMQAYQDIESSLTAADRKKVLIVRAAHDAYVPASDGEVAGAHTYILPSVGHVFSVFMALTLCRRHILRFITRGA